NNIKTQKTIQSVKPIQDLSKLIKYKQYKKVATFFSKVFYNEVQSISYSSDKIILNEVIFSANEQQFRVIYNQQTNEDLKVLAIVYTIDKEHISRNMYHVITKIKQNLSKEWVIFKMKQQIDNQMQQAISIQTINLDANISQTNLEINESINIDDFEIVEEVTKSIGKAAYRSLKDILSYIIPSLVQKGVL
ncbi:6220_t:CDS:1, partial [Cetraspora pellucida]